MFDFHFLFVRQSILDDRLKHPNCGVVLGTVRLFIRLTQDMPQLHDDVYARIHGTWYIVIEEISLSQMFECDTASQNYVT